MYLENYPIWSFILYGTLLLFTIHHLKEHLKRINKGEDTEFIKFLLIFLVIIGVYEFIGTTKNVVKSGKKAEEKIDNTIKEIKIHTHAEK